MKRLLIPCILLSILAHGQANAPRKTKPTASEQPSLAVLTLEQVLQWENQYSYLLGLSEEKIAGKLGPEVSRKGDPDGRLCLGYLAARKNDRPLLICLLAGSAYRVTIEPNSTEGFYDVGELISQADKFKFESGVFATTTTAFLLAERGRLMLRLVGERRSNGRFLARLDSVILTVDH